MAFQDPSTPPRDATPWGGGSRARSTPVRGTPSRTSIRTFLSVGVPWLLCAALSLTLGACEDDPFQVNWLADPDTVLLYSLARPELNLPSGYNFNARQRVRIEAPAASGSWDVALDSQEGELVFLPPGALNITSRARVTALPDAVFEDVREAPRDTAVYSANEAVPIEMNSVYVVRTSESLGSFGRRCVYFAKLEPLEIDVAAGTLRFVFDASPVCNDPRLVPPNQ